jgi:hypothetical protein
LIMLARLGVQGIQGLAGDRHQPGPVRVPVVAGGVDLVSVKASMGHSRITTTERYLHARSASELADRFTRALAPAESPVAVSEAP